MYVVSPIDMPQDPITDILVHDYKNPIPFKREMKKVCNSSKIVQGDTGVHIA